MLRGGSNRGFFARGFFFLPPGLPSASKVPAMKPKCMVRSLVKFRPQNYNNKDGATEAMRKIGPKKGLKRAFLGT